MSKEEQETNIPLHLHKHRKKPIQHRANPHEHQPTTLQPRKAIHAQICTQSLLQATKNHHRSKHKKNITSQ